MITYEELVTHVVPGPRNLAYFGPFILLPASLLIPRSVLSRSQNVAIFIPIITLCTIQAWRGMEGVDVISTNGLLWSLFLIALQDPWSDFRWVSVHQAKAASHGRPRRSAKPPTDVLVEQSYPLTLGSRILWIGRLLASIRLDYWRINRPSHDRLQPPVPGFKSRRAFLLHSVLSFTRGFAVLDLTRCYIDSDPYFTDPTVAITSSLPFAATGPMTSQFFRSTVVGAQAWALIGQMFYLPAAIPVVLNAVGLVPDKASPHNWPPYFGSPRAIFLHGVRGFWGTFWHQTMRWTTTGPGYALADCIGLSRKSLLRYGILSISAFGLSGLVHMGLVPPQPWYAVSNVDVIRLHMAGFFWSQAIAVIIEALVARSVQATSKARWDRGTPLMIRVIVNALWVVTWFGLCIPLLAEAARQLGYWRVWPLPVSVLRGLAGKGYSTWI